MVYNHNVPIVSLEINGKPSCMLMMANNKVAPFMIHGPCHEKTCLRGFANNTGAD